MKRVVHELARGRLDRTGLIEAASTRDAYFVPSGTTLNTQLLNSSATNAASPSSSTNMVTFKVW